jgi:hypothetical protein
LPTFIDNSIPHATLKIRELMRREVITMLIFRCTDCNETISTADDEGAVEIVDKVERHIIKCPLATFTYGGTTDAGRQRADSLRSVIVEAHLAKKPAASVKRSTVNAMR